MSRSRCEHLSGYRVPAVLPGPTWPWGQGTSASKAQSIRADQRAGNTHLSTNQPTPRCSPGHACPKDSLSTAGQWGGLCMPLGPHPLLLPRVWSCSDADIADAPAEEGAFFWPTHSKSGTCLVFPWGKLLGNKARESCRSSPSRVLTGG